VRPIALVDELRADVFESDEELDEFLADLEEFRHQLATPTARAGLEPDGRCCLLLWRPADV
jgi:hypothetical protein